MSELPRITDEESLKSWLRGRPTEDAAIIAHRAAMRGLPRWFATLDEGWILKMGFTAIPTLRAQLVGTIMCKYPILASNSVAATADAADNPFAPYAAFAPAEFADGSVDIPIQTDITFQADSVFAPFDEIEGDVHALIEGRNILKAPLWVDKNPLLDDWKRSHQNLLNTPGGEFWIDWYQRALDGRPQNWPLLRDVASIDVALWNENGPELDARITGLRQEYALVATANSERVEVNPETGCFRLVPQTDWPDDIATYTRRKIIKAVEIFEGQTGQGYNALDSDRAMLRRAVEDVGNLPVELYDACTSATNRLRVRIANGECPSAEQDALIWDYHKLLREAGLDIFGSDPETVRVLERRAKISGNDALIEAREVALESVEAIGPLLEGRLADTLPLDVRTATDENASVEERAAASFRFSGRWLRIEHAAGIAHGVKKASSVVVGTANYIRSLEYLASSPAVRSVMEAIFRYIGF